MEHKFIKGLILGGLLTAAIAAVVASKQGREFTKKMKSDLKPMCKHWKEDISTLSEDAKEDFDEIAADFVEEFAKKKELSIEAKTKLINALKSGWQETKEKIKDKEIPFDNTTT